MSDHVLITGATGLVGRAAMEHFAKSGVRTTAVSRRMPLNTYGATWASLDLADERACADLFSRMTDVTQVVFAALHEEPQLVSGWLEDRHIKRNGSMLRNVVEPLDRVAANLRNITILQGPKAYGVHVGRMRPTAREDRDEAYDVPNFYWEQENYLKAKQMGRPWAWTIIRPSLVVGMAVGGAMNLIAAIGVYAALLKEKGQPLFYPGGASTLLDATDTDLMARCFELAGKRDAARNQTFNVTNGELFTIRSQWEVIADALGMEPGPDRPISFEEELPKEAHVWDAIRTKHGLKAPAMDAFLGQSLQFADFVFARALRERPEGAPMSSIKARAAGFNDVLYTDEMLRKWFARYQAEGLLPP